MDLVFVRCTDPCLWDLLDPARTRACGEVMGSEALQQSATKQLAVLDNMSDKTAYSTMSLMH